MDLEALREELSALLKLEVSSLSRHLEDARPHLSPKTYPLWSQIRHLSASSTQNVHRLTDLFESLRMAPRPVTFKIDVARFHFTALPTLIPMLVEEKQRKIEICQRAIALASDEPAVGQVLASLLDDYRSQLALVQACRDKIEGKSRPSAAGA